MLYRIKICQVFLKIRSDIQTSKYIDREIPENENDSLLMLKNLIDGCLKQKWFFWGIFLKENGVLIGTICLWNFSNERKKCELGFEILPEYQRKGYVSESVDEVILFAKETLHINLLEGFTDSKNTDSINLLTKKGFRFQENKKENSKHSDKERILSIYQLKIKQ